ncbi:MAG: DUF4055 domain-containing protein, partial [Planctomycetota bacterium]
MGVDSRHRLYDPAAKLWVKTRDTISGEDRIKAKGSVYLPPLGAHLEDSGGSADYEAYKERASFYGAARRTRDSLSGTILRKEPFVTWPAGQEGRLKRITKDGKSLDVLNAITINEQLSVGRIALLVDDDRSEASNPFVSYYWAEAVVNWRMGRVGERERVVMLVLNVDEYEPKEDDAFVEEKVERRKVLRLGTEPPIPPDILFVNGPNNELSIEEQLNYLGLKASELEEPVYWQEMWERHNVSNKGGESADSDWVHMETVVPRAAGGRVLREIPAEVINATDLGVELEEPPMLDLVNVNLSHYKTSADLEHGRHWTALPTAWASGFPLQDNDGNPIELRVGAQEAWISERSDARAGYLEFTGAGLGHLADGMKDKERQMAVLGARLLEEPATKGVEAAETVRLRQAGERSVLSQVADTASAGISRILFWLNWWVQPSATEESASIVFNNDFDVGQINPTELISLMQLVQAGLMSYPTMFWNMKRGEVIPDGLTLEDEQKLIDETMANMLPEPAPPEPEEEPDDEPESDEDDED